MLVSGTALAPVTVAYETYGQLDEDGSNAVFVCHALTGDSHPARHAPDDQPGWWEQMVGAGRPVDTDRHFVICANVLGGCAGTTGAWSPGPTGRPYGGDFPSVEVADMVAVHRALLAHLGVRRLRAVMGGSLGGMQVLEWLLSAPDDAASFLIIAGTARHSAENLAWNAVARAAMDRFDAFAGGRTPASCASWPEVHLFSFASDRLYGHARSHYIHSVLEASERTARHHHDTTAVHGHDTFLLDVPSYLGAVARCLNGSSPGSTPRTSVSYARLRAE